MLGSAGSPTGEELLTVTVVRDEHGYGMKVSGDNPVYVQSVKELGAAWRAGLRAGDRILRVDGVPVHTHTHQQVVLMIRANPSTVLTVHQNSQRLKTPITAPLPVNPEKQRQLEFAKVNTVRLMLANELKYVTDLKSEISKVPDVRKQADLESAERRCAKLQREIDIIVATQPDTSHPSTPRLTRNKEKPAGSPPQNTGFLSGLPRSLSNLTGQSLRNLRQRQKTQQENQPPIQRPDEKRRHNNTVPMVPTTCLDNSPPPLPPRSIRNPLTQNTSPINPLAKPKPGSSITNVTPSRYQYRNDKQLRRSSHSLDGDLDGPQPNSIALQMSYPLVNAPPPPLQMDNRGNLPVMHVRSQSSPEHLDHGLANLGPPGTPPPPYSHNPQPCSDPQRAIISMEEDDSPASDNSIYSGLFSNLRQVRESKTRTAILLNWLLGEKRCACANLLLLITDGYRSAPNVTVNTLRRWAYEILSTFLMPNAVLQLSGVDENMANEIEHVLSNEYDKEEILRNVFRKARHKAKEELAQQLSEFQIKRQVGLGTLYGPEDSVIEKCDVDKVQEQLVVERLLAARVSALATDVATAVGAARLAAVVAAAVVLQCRPTPILAAAGGARSSFLQRDKLYKQRLKQLTKQNPHPFIVRGHHLQLEALTSVAHCHVCDLVIWGLAPQAYVCTECRLRVHRLCARSVEESCCLGEPPRRISRLMERIHAPHGQDSNDKKSKKATSAHFLNMERSFRKNEDEPLSEPISTHIQGESKREGSSEEPQAIEPDVDVSDNKETNKDNWRAAPPSGRGVNRAESCRERDAPRRGKHRNASDPNRLTAHNNHDLEGAPAAPSGSSSSSSLSSRSNESNTAATDQQASQSDWSDEEEPLSSQWADSLPPQLLSTLLLSSNMRKRQEVIHELIVSEGSHVRWLKVLLNLFLKPLERQPGLLPPDELRALFPNLPAVRERHSRLYADLRNLRANNNIVDIRGVADAILLTLGDSNYSTVLARFCRGQRQALDALRERRRKMKELHAFLMLREQSPRCARLQLSALLACVWQRLTKYQLLLENIVATVKPETEDSEEDVARLKLALTTAKDVLQAVDTAIRTAENQHRLKSITSKLEIRPGEVEELRRFDLSSKTLRLEGELALRSEAKRIVLSALLFEDRLVLLHREGEKFVLKPLGGQPALSPLVKWDKVIFRPNAAVRNTFFLANINGVQMHELSANNATEYATWVKHIQEAPLAKISDLKTSAHTRSTEESANVSRNPSDASEKSDKSERRDDVIEREKSEELDKRESQEKVVASQERCTESQERVTESQDRVSVVQEGVSEGQERVSESQERVLERRDSQERDGDSPKRRISMASSNLVAYQETPRPAVMRASTQLSFDERLRRVDSLLSRCLRTKSGLLASVLGVSVSELHTLADMALADTLGHLDISNDSPDLTQEGNTQKLILAAHAQVTLLSEEIAKPLNLLQVRRDIWESPLRNNSQPIYEDIGSSDDAMLSEQDLTDGEDEVIDHAELARRINAAAAAATRLQRGAAGLARSSAAARRTELVRHEERHRTARESNHIPETDDGAGPIQDQPTNGG